MTAASAPVSKGTAELADDVLDRPSLQPKEAMAGIAFRPVDDEDRGGNVEGGGAMMTSVGVGHDLALWSSFRSSLPADMQMSLKKSLTASHKLGFMSSFSEYDDLDEEGEDSDDDEDDDFFAPKVQRSAKTFKPLPSFNEREESGSGGCGDEKEADPGDVDESPARSETAAASEARELTREERFDNARWRMRLEVNEVFSPRYDPKEWERREMSSVVDFLGLMDPGEHPGYLVSVHVAVRAQLSREPGGNSHQCQLAASISHRTSHLRARPEAP